MAELMRRYGAETVITVMQESIRYSERRMRERVRALPDGEVRTRGFLDHDGTQNRVYRTDVRIIKKGDQLRIDMSDSSPQAPGYINCTEGCLVGAIFGGVAPLLGAGIPWNHGILNAIEVVAPKGLICNANPPSATGAATIGQGWVITSTTAHAISKLLALSNNERRHSQAVTHGTMAAFFTGDRNQHGEPFGNQLIDAQIGGGGASALRDGIDQSGCFVSPKPHIANIEGNELHGPMLFLYRSFFPDTGGDGTHRGGRAAGTAWTPHGVDRLRCSLTSHGVDVPVSFGQFGGWPGVCSTAMIVHGTQVRERWAEGRLPLQLNDIRAPLDLESLGGQVQVLEAKQDELPIFPGDIVQYTWQGGGGYGDPLDRNRDEVIRDIELGIISNEHAKSVYGEVAGGPSDQTSDRRCIMRQMRLERANSPGSNGANEAKTGQALTKFGSGLILARNDNDELQFECICGFVFCNADENWKLNAASHRFDQGELPPGIRVHETLELAEYLCPSCGRRHALDVQVRDEPPLQDLLITNWPG